MKVVKKKPKMAKMAEMAKMGSKVRPFDRKGREKRVKIIELKIKLIEILRKM